MREILFRGRRIDNSEWVEGFYSYCTDGDKLSHRIYISFAETYGEKILHPMWFEIDPATVGQYTGRTAQCTDEIFEGDRCIVTVFDYNGADTQHECVVEWADGGFAFVNEEKEIIIPLMDVQDTDSDVEVLGNIHDNPEFLEAGEAGKGEAE